MTFNSKKIIPLVLLIMSQNYSFNNIHYNSYNLKPEPIYFSTLNISSGLYLDPGDLSAFSLPISAALNLTPDFELGTGIKTVWGEGGDNISHVLVGVKIGLTGKATVQADLMLGLDNPNGFSITYLKRNDFFSHFFNYSQVKFGLLNHFTSDALFSFEAGFYPTLKIINPVSLQLGLITSSQTGEFENHLAMDLTPTLLVELSGESDLSVVLVSGLAGDRKSDTGLQIIFGFSL